MSENESFARWDETVSSATKLEMDEAHINIPNFGRRIDILVITRTTGEEKAVELVAIEHKKFGEKREVMLEQQNKNIITNACIITQLKKRFKVETEPNSITNPLIMNIQDFS
ncbi:hypothetical protein INT45_001874 [Circinella minor]|uniref:Uncharacterized protein n=1 Tax=Circinella minor TaxID=1195481 RepID=A0A8H7S0T7_9FUNG|nr:hypothetical protein INT45_001874 [Circinella minor]